MRVVVVAVGGLDQRDPIDQILDAEDQSLEQRERLHELRSCHAKRIGGTRFSQQLADLTAGSNERINAHSRILWVSAHGRG